MRCTRWLTASVGIALLGLAAAGPAAAGSAADADRLVREIYYEGMPADQAETLDADGIAHLRSLLQDPEERALHGNAVLALGMSGHADAFPVLAAFGRRAPSGEIDRDTFRARLRLAQAMGHLARTDPRALHWLLARADRPPRPPAWRFRHHQGPRLAQLLEEQVLTGLALSGADQAHERLRRAEQRAGSADTPGERRRRHAAHALQTHRRVADGGRPDPHGPGVAR
ncbi:MAG: hypothetical protein ACQGVC_10100 [Myxococcota bacterium]